MHDPYPFFRGMLAEAGYKVAKIPYDQPVRIKGVTKNNFYTLYDMGILGIICNSKSTTSARNLYRLLRRTRVQRRKLGK